MTTYARPAWIFRRLLGVVYVCAFSSMVVQLDGLFGSDGILPARDFMQAAREWTGADGLGLARFHVVPTLFWISTSDAFLSTVCIMGVVAGVLLAAGVAPLITTALPWIAYLSLMTVGQDFLGYQWDALLLETGFFALFVAPAPLAGPAARRGAADAGRGLAAPLAVVPADGRVGRRQAFERRPHLGESHCADLPFRDAAAANPGRLVPAPRAGVAAQGPLREHHRHRAVRAAPDRSDRAGFA